MKILDKFEPNRLQIKLLKTLDSGSKENRLDDFLLDGEEIEALSELAKNDYVEEGSPDWDNNDKTTARWISSKGRRFLENK